MKLHLGCGSVYLVDYVNIDLPSPRTFLAESRPDLVERWKTTEDKYYAKHKDKSQDTLRAGPLDQEYVCDQFGDFLALPAAAWTVDEILARHVFEHLSITEAHKALDQCDEVMKCGGLLRLDVPDHEMSLKAYAETRDEFYVRHLLGPRRTDHGFHIMSYTRERLRSLVEDHGFVFVCEEPNPHFYPAFTLRFGKPCQRAPYDYIKLPTIQPTERFVDVGPGQLPHPRANVLIDCDKKNIGLLRSKGMNVIHGDLMQKLENIPDKSFDYAWCSHVLEHVADPELAALTLSRIAKRGTIVMPSAWKESLTNFEERSHIWQVLPDVTGRRPLFIKCNDERLEQMRALDTMKSMSQIFRTGPNRINDKQRQLRRWWYDSEAALDVVVHWNDEVGVRVIK